MNRDLRNLRAANGIKLLFSSVAVVLLIVHLIQPGLQIDVISLGLLLAAALPWLPHFIRDFELPGGWKVSFQELKDAVEVQEEVVQEQGKEIKDHTEIIGLIYKALMRSLTKYEYQHLIELDSDDPLPNYQHSDFLRNEMIRLCQHGYATETFEHSTWKMKDMGDTRFDLKEFYRITDEGKSHLKLLRRLEASVANQHSEDEI